MGKRRPVPPGIEASILIRCKRRCCLCFFLDGKEDERVGQIAHLDRNPGNNIEDNLAFLCLRHHHEYDSRGGLGKRLKIREVKHARKKLYERLQGESAKRGTKREPQRQEDSDGKTVMRFFWLAQLYVAYTSTKMELSYNLFEQEAKELSLTIDRDEIPFEHCGTAGVVPLRESIEKIHGLREAEVFGLGFLIAVMPFSFEERESLATLKAMVEKVALEQFGGEGLVSTAEFTASLPCEIPKYVERVEALKGALEGATP